MCDRTEKQMIDWGSQLDILEEAVYDLTDCDCFVHALRQSNHRTLKAAVNRAYKKRFGKGEQ